MHDCCWLPCARASQLAGCFRAPPRLCACSLLEPRVLLHAVRVRPCRSRCGAWRTTCRCRACASATLAPSLGTEAWTTATWPWTTCACVSCCPAPPALPCLLRALLCMPLASTECPRDLQATHSRWPSDHPSKPKLQPGIVTYENRGQVGLCSMLGLAAASSCSSPMCSEHRCAYRPCCLFVPWAGCLWLLVSVLGGSLILGALPRNHAQQAHVHCRCSCHQAPACARTMCCCSPCRFTCCWSQYRWAAAIWRTCQCACLQTHMCACACALMRLVHSLTCRPPAFACSTRKHADAILKGAARWHLRATPALQCQSIIRHHGELLVTAPVPLMWVGERATSPSAPHAHTTCMRWRAALARLQGHPSLLACHPSPSAGPSLPTCACKACAGG